MTLPFSATSEILDPSKKKPGKSLGRGPAPKVVAHWIPSAQTFAATDIRPGRAWEPLYDGPPSSSEAMRLLLEIRQADYLSDTARHRIDQLLSSAGLPCDRPTLEGAPGAEEPVDPLNHSAVYPPDGAESSFPVVNLGHGEVRMGDCIHDETLPGLWFGKGGSDQIDDQCTLERDAAPGELLTVITFANVEGLDVMLKALLHCRKSHFPDAPPAYNEGFLPERVVGIPAEAQGHFRKFEVSRVDKSDLPGGKHHGCRYFVIDADHDPYARAALTAIAAVCDATHPHLAQDLREKWGAGPAIDDDGARWRAFLGCARIRALGSAGLEMPEPNHYAHMGLEIWTRYGRDYSPELLKQMDEGNARARRWLNAFTDVAIEAQKHGDSK